MKKNELIRESGLVDITCISYCKDVIIVNFNGNLVILGLDPPHKLLALDSIGDHSLIFNNTQCLLSTGNPYSPNKLIFFDSLQRLLVGVIEFNQPITAIDTSTQFIAISLESSVYLYSTSPSYHSQLLHKHSTHSNPISQINTQNFHSLFISSGMKLGHLHVNHLHQTHLQSSTLFQPHISRVSAISISSDNSLFATSSIKGTIIRVYNSITLQLTHQLRRGSDIAHITSSSLSFSPDNRHLALISDKSTLHLWNLSNGSRSRSTSLFHLPSLNLHSSLSPFVSSSQQYAHYNNFQESFVLAWESINTIIITSTFGRLFKFSVSYEEGDKSSLQPLDFNNFVSLLRS